MHIVIVTWGSTGDILPLIALAHALQAHHHQVSCGARNIGLALSDLLWGQDIHTFRAHIGLPPIPSISHMQFAAPLNLVAVSKHLLPPDQTWPSNHHIAGFWSLDHAPHWQPDPTLRAFLPAGEAPIIISFGSMAGNNATATTELLLDAIQRVGRRTIIQTGWGQIGTATLPDHILTIEAVPHDWLFAHAACVIHHGGADTTAAALRAGIPAVIV